MNREVIIRYNDDYTYDIFAKQKHNFSGYDIQECILRKSDNKFYFCKRITGDAFSLCDNIRCIASSNEPNLKQLKKKFNGQVLVIPSTVERIDDGTSKTDDFGKQYFTGAFKLCGVEECYLKRSNIDYIGENAFGCCDLLKFCVLPQISTLKVKDFAFYKCNKIKSILYEPSFIRSRLGMIFTAETPILFSRCFSRCGNLRHVELPIDRVLIGEKHFHKTQYSTCDDCVDFDNNTSTSIDKISA